MSARALVACLFAGVRGTALAQPRELDSSAWGIIVSRWRMVMRYTVG